MTWDFLHPGRLWLLLGVLALVALYAVMQWRRRRNTVRFSSLSLFDKVAPSRPGWRRHAAAAVYLLGLVVGVFAIAQPQQVVKVPRQRATIVLALDTSLSMQATDVEPDRITAAKSAATQFVKAIPEKLNVGLVSFDGATRVEQRPSTDRTAVVSSIESLELHPGTAIGDAVQTSLDVIEQAPKGEDGKPIPAVIVLMSDGSRTVGSSISQAIASAKEAGIGVYTIAFGTEGATIDLVDPETGDMLRQRVDVDTEALATLAEQTGGKPFVAESASDLGEVYHELGSSIGYDTEHRDVTFRYLVAAMAVLSAAGLMSVMLSQRLP